MPLTVYQKIITVGWQLSFNFFTSTFPFASHVSPCFNGFKCLSYLIQKVNPHRPWIKECVWGQAAPHLLPVAMARSLSFPSRQASCSASWWPWMRGILLPMILLMAYAKKAAQSDRIKEALKEPCCAKQCKRGLHWKLVLKMVMFFWALPKCSQDCFLWSMQQCHDWNDEDDENGSDSSSSSQQRHEIS